MFGKSGSRDFGTGSAQSTLENRVNQQQLNTHGFGRKVSQLKAPDVTLIDM
jgi:hypothetical protein